MAIGELHEVRDRACRRAELNTQPLRLTMTSIFRVRAGLSLAPPEASSLPMSCRRDPVGIYRSSRALATGAAASLPTADRCDIEGRSASRRR